MTVKAKAGRPTADELARRKQTILEVATKAFVESGFSAASLTQIARDARVTARTIYEHFGDKAALFGAVIRSKSGYGSLIKEYLDTGTASQIGLRETLLKTAQAILAIVLDDDNIEFQRLLAAEQGRFPEMIEKLVREDLADMEQAVTELFEELHAQGMFARKPDISDVQLFYELVQGTHAYHRVLGYPDDLPTRAKLERKIDMFARSMATPTE